MEPGGSMPHSQGFSNNPYPEPNQHNSLYSFVYTIKLFFFHRREFVLKLYLPWILQLFFPFVVVAVVVAANQNPSITGNLMQRNMTGDTQNKNDHRTHRKHSCQQIKKLAKLQTRRRVMYSIILTVAYNHQQQELSTTQTSSPQLMVKLYTVDNQIIGGGNIFQKKSAIKMLQ